MINYDSQINISDSVDLKNASSWSNKKACKLTSNQFNNRFNAYQFFLILTGWIFAFFELVWKCENSKSIGRGFTNPKKLLNRVSTAIFDDNSKIISLRNFQTKNNSAYENPIYRSNNFPCIIMARTLVDDFFGLLTSQKIVTFASFFKTKCHFDASLTFSFFLFLQKRSVR